MRSVCATMCRRAKKPSRQPSPRAADQFRNNLWLAFFNSLLAALALYASRILSVAPCTQFRFLEVLNIASNIIPTFGKWWVASEFWPMPKKDRSKKTNGKRRDYTMLVLRRGDCCNWSTDDNDCIILCIIFVFVHDLPSLNIKSYSFWITDQCFWAGLE